MYTSQQPFSIIVIVTVYGEIENWWSQWKKVGWTGKGFEEEPAVHWLSLSEEQQVSYRYTRNFKINNLCIYTLIIYYSLFCLGEEISIADLMCLCQITQYWICDFALEEYAPNVKRWVEDCKQALNPQFDTVHEVVYECRKAGTFKTTFNIWYIHCRVMYFAMRIMKLAEQ